MKKSFCFLLIVTGYALFAQQPVFYPVKIVKNTFNNDSLIYSDTIKIIWDNKMRITRVNNTTISYSPTNFTVNDPSGDKEIGLLNNNGKLIKYEDKFAAYVFKYDENNHISSIDQNYLDEEVPDFVMISYNFKDGNIVQISEEGTIYDLPYGFSDSILYYPDKANTLPFLIGPEGISFDYNADIFNMYGIGVQAYRSFFNENKNLVKEIIHDEDGTIRKTDITYKTGNNGCVETIEIKNDGFESIRHFYTFEY